MHFFAKFNLLACFFWKLSSPFWLQCLHW